LFAAAHQGHSDIVWHLLTKGADPDTAANDVHHKDLKPIDIALKHGHIEVVDLIFTWMTRRILQYRLTRWRMSVKRAASSDSRGDMRLAVVLASSSASSHDAEA
jgi:hypothetical protein